MTEEEVDSVQQSSVGDIVTLQGKEWKITKKTKTAIATEPYFWYNKWWDKLFK